MKKIQTLISSTHDISPKFNLFTVKELFVHFIRMIIQLLLGILAIWYYCALYFSIINLSPKNLLKILSFFAFAFISILFRRHFDRSLE